MKIISQKDTTRAKLKAAVETGLIDEISDLVPFTLAELKAAGWRAEVLPHCLSAKEEAEAIAGCQSGDIACRNRLIERNLRLVVYIAKKFENTGINIEDLISIGTIGLIKAIETYTMDEGITLADYASRCIENDIHKLLLSDILGTEPD